MNTETDRELLPIDEITHFQRESHENKNVISPLDLSHVEVDVRVNGKEDKKGLVSRNGKNNKTVTIVAPSPNTSSFSNKLRDLKQYSMRSNLKNSKLYEKAETGYISDSDGSESDIVFNKKPKMKLENESQSGSRSSSYSQSSSNNSNNNEHVYKNTKNIRSANYSNFSISDENMMNIPALNTVQVNLSDGMFAFIVFITNLTECVTDFTLIFWHFANGYKWASGLTAAFVVVGAIGLLQQFSLLQRDHLERLFRHSKRVRILVNCFPPLATIITAYQSSNIAYRSIKNPMLSNQFFEIEEFSKSLSKIQSFFQAAPLATLQLIVFIDSIDEISPSKALFTILNILVSLIVMTNAFLPAKSDYTDMESIHRAAYIPTSRLFVGLRMLSNFGSRAMAITFLVFGFHCLLGEDSMLNSVVSALFIMAMPRLVFTIIDYAHQLVTWRRQNELAAEAPPATNRDTIVNNMNRQRTHSRSEISCFDTMLGYSATVFFPVGDPLWVFWYVWAETAFFVLFGNITGWTKSCLPTLVNAIYTAVFIVVFIVVPILIPYAKATVKRQRMKRLDKIFDWKNNVNSTESADGNNDNSNSASQRTGDNTYESNNANSTL